jgi:hypothetical protein
MFKSLEVQCLEVLKDGRLALVMDLFMCWSDKWTKKKDVYFFQDRNFSRQKIQIHLNVKQLSRICRKANFHLCRP